MRFIDKITKDAKQQFTLIGEAGQIIDFLLYFMPTQNSWFFNISNEGFTANGIRLCASPNILRSFRNNISFGLCCISRDGFDPNSIDDFTSGRIQIYTLNADDVLEIESSMFT